MKQLFLSILFSLLFFSAPAFFSCSSYKGDTMVPEEPLYKAPSQIKKTIEVFSNFDRDMIIPVIQFINSSTGLSCSLTAKSEGIKVLKGKYDLFIGTCFQDDPVNIVNYSSGTWSKIGSSFYKDGVFIWSKWHSCLAVNSIFTEELNIEVPNTLPVEAAHELPLLIGKITTVNPVNDPLLLSVFSTLYRTYGKDILIDINNMVPLYRSSREELIFAVESGQYPAVLGIDGYFQNSISKGYPISIVYSSFSKEKYPVTTVSGNNIVFIPADANNREGAKYIIDFMASSIFQSFLLNSYFMPILKTSPQTGNQDLSTDEPEKVLPLECDKSGLEELKQVWEELAFPKGTKKILNQ